jgi:hypothetical protein
MALSRLSPIRGLAACTLVLAAFAAMAERSRVGEGEESIEAGECELEAGSRRTAASGMRWRYESSWQAACGVGARSELALVLTRGRSDGQLEQEQALEGRVIVLARSAARPGLALLAGWQRQRAGGQRWHSSEHSIGLEAALQPRPAWLLSATLGTQRERGARRDSTRWELGIERGFGELAELALTWEGDDRGAKQAGLSLRLQVVPEHLQLTLLLGQRREAVRERVQAVTLTLEF